MSNCAVDIEKETKREYFIRIDKLACGIVREIKQGSHTARFDGIMWRLKITLSHTNIEYYIGEDIYGKILTNLQNLKIQKMPKQILTQEEPGATYIEDFKLDDITELTGKKQKEAAKNMLFELKQNMQDIRTDLDVKSRKMQEAVAKINMLPIMKDLKNRKKEIGQLKKKYDTMINIYIGGLKAIKELGVKLDAATLREIGN